MGAFGEYPGVPHRHLPRRAGAIEIDHLPGPGIHFHLGDTIRWTGLGDPRELDAREMDGHGSIARVAVGEAPAGGVTRVDGCPGAFVCEVGVALLMQGKKRAGHAEGVHVDERGGRVRSLDSRPGDGDDVDAGHERPRVPDVLLPQSLGGGKIDGHRSAAIHGHARFAVGRALLADPIELGAHEADGDGRAGLVRDGEAPAGGARVLDRGPGPGVGEAGIGLLMKDRRQSGGGKGRHRPGENHQGGQKPDGEDDEESLPGCSPGCGWAYRMAFLARFQRARHISHDVSTSFRLVTSGGTDEAPLVPQP